MGVYERNDSWWIDYYVEGRRRREKIGLSKKLAEMVLKKRLVEIAEGKFLDVKRRPEIGFDEAVEKYMEWARANKSSWVRDRQSLAHWTAEFAGKRISQIGKLDIERYKLKRKDQVAPRTVNEEIACLRRLFYRMMEWGLAEANPVKGVKFLRQPPGRLKMLSPEEEGRLLAACNPHVRPVVLTALHSGMRYGEIINLEWRDLDFQRGVLIVRNSKNGERREIPMSDTLRAALAGIPRVSDKVFVSRSGKPYRSVRTAFENAARKAGLVDFRFHDTRHAFASSLRMKGADLFLIKELLGHKSLDMVMRYAHITSERKQETIKLLDGHGLDTGGETASSQESQGEAEVAELKGKTNIRAGSSVG